MDLPEQRSASALPDSAPTMSQRIIIVCATMFAVLPLATDITLVALPDIAAEYQRGLVGGHQVMAAFVLGLAVAHLFIGGLADRYGRRPVAIAGFAVFTIASILGALSTNFEMLVSMRFLQGLSGATGPVLVRSIVRDLSERGGGQRPMASIAAISGLAPLFAPVIGAVIAGILGWRGVFAFLSIYGAATTLALILFLSETQPASAKTTRLRFLSVNVLMQLLRDRHFLLGSLVMAVGYGCLFTWLTAAGFIVTTELGGTRNDLAMLYTIGSLGYIIGASAAIRVPERWNTIRTGAVIGFAGAALCIGIVWGAPNIWWLSPIALYYSSWAIMQPLAIATAMRNHAAHAGQASAVAGALQLCGGLALSSLAIALGGGLIVLPLIATTLALLLIVLWHHHKRPGFNLV